MQTGRSAQDVPTAAGCISRAIGDGGEDGTAGVWHTQKERAVQTLSPPKTAASPKGIQWRRWRQHLAALLANLAVVATGVAMAWSAPALPVLLGQVADAQPLRLTLEQGSWASALVPLGALLGALPAGPIADRLGRRGALLALAPPFVAGWLLIAFADTSIWLVYAGRFLTGLVAGCSTVFVPIYCEEIAEVAIRGALGSYVDMMMILGSIYLYILGALLSYFWFTILSIVVPIVFAVTFFWMPETPLFLLRKNRHEAARKSLRWLRGPTFDIQPEYDLLLASIEKVDDRKHVKINFQELFCMNPFRSTTVRAFGIVLALMFFQQMSGISIFVFYAVDIFEEAGSNLSGYLCSIIIGITHFLACMVALITVDRVGRRFLLITTSAVGAICLAALTVYTYLHSKEYDTSSWSWLPLTSLIGYLAFYSLGFGTLPWFMMAELMPDNSKGWASSVAVCFNRLLMLILTKEFPILVENVGQEVAYGTFAACCFLGCIFAYFCVPETKGIPKSQILTLLGGDKP